MTVLSTTEIYNRLWGFEKPDMSGALADITLLEGLLAMDLINRVKIYKPSGECYNITPPTRKSGEGYLKSLERAINEIEGVTYNYTFYRKGTEEEITETDISAQLEAKDPVILFALASTPKPCEFKVAMTYKTNPHEWVGYGNQRYRRETILTVVWITDHFVTIRSVETTYREEPELDKPKIMGSNAERRRVKIRKRDGREYIDTHFANAGVIKLDADEWTENEKPTTVQGYMSLNMGMVNMGMGY